MANYSRILLVSALLGLTALPAGATGDAAPTVVGSFAEQASINKTRFILMFNAPIENLTGEDFQVSAGCTFGYLEILDATAQVELLDCPSGQVDLVLLANTVGSSVLGPAENHVISIEIDVPTPDLPAPPSTPTPPTNPTPEPTPTPPPISNPEPTPNPDPAPTPPPVAESPTTSPEIQQSSSPSVSDLGVTTVSESVAVDWNEELVVVTITPPANNELEGTTTNQESLLAALQLEVEAQQKESPNPVEATSEELVVEQVAGDELEFDQARGSQWIWLIGLGSLTLLITGLIRRFSGR
jgi:hypothetical protein